MKTLPGHTGKVEDLGFFYAKLLNDENVVISMPNSELIQAMIFNFSESDIGGRV
jgi:small-conductance mechanosensitive channel